MKEGYYTFVLQAFQTFIVPVLGYAAFMLRGIRGELRALNGRMIDMERWRMDHDKTDEHHHAEVGRRLDRLENVK